MKMLAFCLGLKTVLSASIYAPLSALNIDLSNVDISELKKYRVSQFKDFLAEYMNVTIENVPMNKDYCNNIYVYSKDGTFAKGDTFTNKTLDVVEAAEHVEIVLDKRGQPFVPLPDMIHSSKTLRSMYLKNVGITETIKIMTGLENLEELEMHSCAIHDISSIIPLNSSLKKLVLNDCDIQNCYIDPDRVPNLTELTITCCNLVEINKEIFFVKNLKKINFSNNHLYGLPKLEDHEETTTVELDLSRNRFVSFPECLRGFNKLKKLNMKGNNLQKRFEFVFSKKNVLEELNLSYNRIKEISKNFLDRKNPKSIRNLKNLKILDLKHNQLEKIPSKIFTLSNLEKLDLSFNKLKSMRESLPWTLRNIFKIINMPREPYKSKKLKELDISYNSLTSLPTSFLIFKHLEKLSLAGNNFTSIPVVLEHMERLKTVDFSFNKLTFIPEFLAKLDRLEELKLAGGKNFRHQVSSNQIRVVPKSIVDRYTKKMIKIDLKGNNLDKESSFFGYGSDELKAYYKDWITL